LYLEVLEAREVPAAVTVNAAQVIRAVNPHVLGTNLAWWDWHLTTAQTQQMVQADGLSMFRLPGGSSSDDWHFTAGPAWNGAGTVATMAGFITSVGGTGLVTMDYGSGSPQEAAALLAYLNAPTTNTTPIGAGEEWSDSANTWMTVDWKSADYWAGIRAATPLAQDDGLNFLRVGRSVPFALRYFEVGNEVYGGWETDHHGQGGDPGQPHDPATYVAFAKQFATYAAQIDPTISIGVDSASVSNYYNNWLANVLQKGLASGFVPGFVSDHSYMQGPGNESDSYLLKDTVSDPNNQDPNAPLDWALRASDYRSLLQQELGSAASGVELLATEYNSVYSNPGKQSTSLVNGLFVADSIGSLLQTEYNAGLFWDLRNGWDTSNNNSPHLYGWRQGGDYGLLGGGGPAPSTGYDIPYPTYFAEQLLSHMVHQGDSVVQAASGDTDLSVYAVKQATGDLDLLVINKSPNRDLTGNFTLTGFRPSTQAQVWQYGKTQDTAQSQTTDGHAALANFTATLTLSGRRFSYLFPSYSMTVLDLARAPRSVLSAPDVADPAALANVPGTGGPGTGNKPLSLAATDTASPGRSDSDLGVIVDANRLSTDTFTDGRTGQTSTQPVPASASPRPTGGAEGSLESSPVDQVTLTDSLFASPTWGADAPGVAKTAG
jgi:hypothetical protein